MYVFLLVLHLFICLGLVGAVLAITMMPAEAAWRSYINRDVGFSFLAPGEMKTEKGVYKSAMAGQRDAVVFRSVEDNVEFKVTVVDFTARTSDEAALLKEATAAFLNNNKVLSDEEARVESDYGRKSTIDLSNNGGRSMAAIGSSRTLGRTSRSDRPRRGPGAMGREAGHAQANAGVQQK